MTHFGDFAQEIYAAGYAGGVPAYPMTYDELERAAEQQLPPEAYGYVIGGAGTESTMRANRAALDAWRITPRMLRAVVDRDLAVEVCGTLMAAPVLLAPVGGLGVVRPDGERQVARVATELGLPMVVSTVSSTSLEDVARELAGGPGWFQLYWPRQQEVAASLVRRAEAAGFGAIVVTVDAWALAWRPRDLANGYVPFLTGEGIANYLTDPAFRAGLARPPEDDPGAAVQHWAANFGNPTLRWSDVAWLREQTRLPVLVKGVCHPDDARAAADAGADGVIVSNHGGRQLDGARAAFDCLPEVVAAAGALPVLFDSGVRSGSDIVKALAMGARAVLVGRPYVWGLAVGGVDGVRHVLRCLLAEFDLTLALSGHRRPSELGPHLLARDGL